MFILIAIIFALIGNGLIKSIFPDFYDASVKLSQKGIASMLVDIKEQQQYVAEMGVGGIKMVVLSFIGFLTSLGYCIWIIATWGAYRDLNNASRSRSFVAFIIACVLFVLVSGMLLQLQSPASSGAS